MTKKNSHFPEFTLPSQTSLRTLLEKATSLIATLSRKWQNAIIHLTAVFEVVDRVQWQREQELVKKVAVLKWKEAEGGVSERAAGGEASGQKHDRCGCRWEAGAGAEARV